MKTFITIVLLLMLISCGSKKALTPTRTIVDSLHTITHKVELTTKPVYWYKVLTLKVPSEDKPVIDEVITSGGNTITIKNNEDGDIVISGTIPETTSTTDSTQNSATHTDTEVRTEVVYVDKEVVPKWAWWLLGAVVLAIIAIGVRLAIKFKLFI